MTPESLAEGQNKVERIKVLRERVAILEKQVAPAKITFDHINGSTAGYIPTPQGMREPIRLMLLGHYQAELKQLEAQFASL